MCVALCHHGLQLCGNAGESRYLNRMQPWLLLLASGQFTDNQYGTQCYCGNTFTPTNSTGCNTPCAGDKDQICGGPWRNSVYVNNAILESTSTSSSSSASSTGTASSSSSSSTTSSSTTAQAASTTSASSSATTTSSTTGTSSPTGSVVTVTVTHTVTETSCPTAHMARRRILYH